MVDADDLPPMRAAGKLGDRHSGSEADLEDTMLWTDVEALDRPRAPLPVRAARRHDPAREAAEDPRGPGELSSQALEHPASDG
jgi:hypothetical protein